MVQPFDGVERIARVLSVLFTSCRNSDRFVLKHIFDT